MTRLDALMTLSLLAVTAACGTSPQEEAAAPVAPVAVRVAPATLIERPQRLEAGGVVAAGATAVVSSRVVAPVVMVAVRPGDRVRAGDALVRLDVRDLSAHARQADAASRAAEQALIALRSAETAAAADQTLATAWHARVLQLRERNSATPQELDEAVARLAAATARVASAQANIEQASAQLASARAAADVATVTESYGVIRAPFDGVVIERHIDPGDLAAPGRPLLQVDAAGERRVDVRVDEARAAYVRPGDRVVVLLDDANAAAAEIQGIVAEVARAVAADQRAFTVKVSLPTAVDPRTGTFARVRFDGERRRVLLVPTAAVRRQGQLTSVAVVADGVARIRLVQAGEIGSDGIEIVSGLDAGEVVVVAPPPRLRDGQRVTPAADGAAR